MADAEIKAEPLCEPKSLFVESEQSSLPPCCPQVPVAHAARSVNNSLQTKSNPTWKRQIDHLHPIQVVEINELAVKNGSVFLDSLETLLNKYSAEIKNSPKWLGKIEAIRQEEKECRVLIGFLGVTGSGKSSLINALLEMVDLLPADDEKACTAVCVEIASNPSDDPKSAFQAVVERIGHEDWRTELEKLFKDIKDEDSDEDRDNGTPDVERPERIKQAFQKIKSVYPLVKTLGDLHTYTVNMLMKHPNIKDILGTTKNIVCSTLEEFSATIKPYIDSSTSKEGVSNGKGFAQWPLVKVVHLQVKSSILTHGVVLVDLPGSMDTNAARGAIAESYQKKLSVTCVVAPTQRAASDKPAQDLLGKITQRTLQLDNRFSSQDLCFIVSKTDTSMTPERYVRTHPNVDQALGPIYEHERRLNENKAEVLQYRRMIEEAKSADRKRLAEINDGITKTIAAINKCGAKGDKKRKRGVNNHPLSTLPRSDAENALISKLQGLQTEQKTVKSEIEIAGNKLYKLEGKMQEIQAKLDILNSQIRAACIKNRNEVTTVDIRADYEDILKQIDYPSGYNPLQVFCVSAIVHSYFQKDQRHEALRLGFLNVAASGIYALQCWLIESTVPTRKRASRAFLEALVSLELSMKPWIEFVSSDYKMENNQRDKVEDLFEKDYQELAKNLQEINLSTVKEAEAQTQTTLWSILRIIEREAASKTGSIVKAWGGMHWSTHKVLNREHGDCKTCKGVEHHWNDELAGPFLDPMIVFWNKALHRQVPSLRGVYDERTSKLIEKFAYDTANVILKICPDMKDALQIWKESSIRTCVAVKKHSLGIFQDTIKNTSDDAHRLVKPKLAYLWRPVYDACGAESGWGHFQRNKTTHINHVSSNGLGMYKQCSRAIQAPFKKLWEILPDELGQGTQSALDQIKEEFQQIIENHTVDGDRELAKGEESAAKLQLQAEYLSILIELNEAWDQKVEEENCSDEESCEDVSIVDLDSVFNDPEEPDVDALWNADESGEENGGDDVDADADAAAAAALSDRDLSGQIQSHRHLQAPQSL